MNSLNYEFNQWKRCLSCHLGGGPETLGSAISIFKSGELVSNVNYHGSEDTLVPRVDWVFVMANKTTRGGLCQGGRLRTKMLRDLEIYTRVDLSKLVTHIYNGFEHIEASLLLMKDKPKDFIKAVVIL